MNRAERRRKERNIKKKTGLSMDDIKEMKEEATQKAFEKVYECLFVLPLLALKEEGYGAKRLARVSDRMVDLLRDVEQGRLDLYKANMEIREKYGIYIDLERE